MIKQLIARRLLGEVQKQWSVSMEGGCEPASWWNTINSLSHLTHWLSTKLEFKHWYFTMVFCIQNSVLLVGMIAML